MNKLRSVFPILFLLSGMMILWSQVMPEGKVISSISIELEGPDTIGKSFILQNLQIETGIPYKSNAIDKSITNLINLENSKMYSKNYLELENTIMTFMKLMKKLKIKKINNIEIFLIKILLKLRSFF